jgi:diaminopimelate decarboxylase
MSSPSSRPPRKLAFVDPAKFTPHFSWRKSKQAGNGEHVFCEDFDLMRAADAFGTPTYLYSRAAISAAYNEFHNGLRGIPHTICFAVKSNGNLSILQDLLRRGSGFDIVSGGELEHLGKLGVPGDRIVFSGVGKTRYEIREALRYRGGIGSGRSDSGILLFNVESEAELEVLLAESSLNARRGGKAPSAAVRVNPDVAAGGHPHISTGKHTHKFGLDWPAARKLYLAHANSGLIRWQGISAHIGSQIVSLAPFREAFRRIAGFVSDLRRNGISLRYLDFGGGLGVRYTAEANPSRRAYARTLKQLVAPLGLHLLLEPGRSIVASAGILLTRVIYTKLNRGKVFVIVDAAMNDLLRPALYGAVHPITRLTRERLDSNRSSERVDIVGPVCETGDCLLHDWPLGHVRSGDLLGIWTVGAYGMSQASNYNARTRPNEVLVDGSRARLIRRRETQADLLRTDVLGASKKPRLIGR